MREAPNGKNDEKHNKKLESHRRATNESDIGAADEFGKGGPFGAFGGLDESDDSAEEKADKDGEEGNF